MEIDRNIFRAYDIRGISDETLTPAVMKQIGMAVGTLMIRRNWKNKLFIGRDARSSSKELSDAFIKGVLTMGIDVVDVGETSFGVALFSGWKNKASVTSFVTASHKPPEWNGIKFYDPDCVGFFEADNQELGRIVIENDFEKSPETPGKVSEQGANLDYIIYLKDKFSVERKLKVVVDCGNGCTAHVVPSLLGTFDTLEVVELFCDIDPKFSGRGSDIEDKNLERLREVVLDTKADLGVALDGDGDRAGFVDDSGNFLSTEQVGLILGREIIRPGDRVVANVETSLMLEEGVNALGATLSKVPVGHTFMMRAVKDEAAVLGLEASKHLVIPKYFPFDDGVIAILKVLELLSEDGRKLSELAHDLEGFPRERLRFECPDDIKFKVVETLKESLSKEYPNTNSLDGIRVDFNDGWVLVRASNTGPVIRITVEAKTEERLKQLGDRFSTVLGEEIKKCKR